MTVHASTKPPLAGISVDRGCQSEQPAWTRLWQGGKIAPLRVRIRFRSRRSEYWTLRQHLSQSDGTALISYLPAVMTLMLRLRGLRPEPFPFLLLPLLDFFHTARTNFFLPTW